ncbi:MAG TPA: glycosyl transferase family protein [Pseudomonadales bacterium]|nr:glycosyl transferase family protein [Pseudomonadales bacterium]
MNGNQEHPFAQYIRILGRGKRSGRSLTEEEAYQAMNLLLHGQVEDVQIGAFLLLIRVREETTDELVGFTKAARHYCAKQIPTQLNATLDWPSYAGKHRHYNWYILAALALADHGIPVFMHGAFEDTAKRLYSAEVLNELGITSCRNIDEALNALLKDNFAYTALETFCAPLYQLLSLRPLLGVRSPINTLVRLINPSNAAYLLTSIFHPPYRSSHQQAALRLGYQHMAVIKGEGGEIECKPDARCNLQMVIDGQLHDEEWAPLLSQRADDATHIDSETLRAVWRGSLSSSYGESAILATLALVLRLMQKAQTQKECLELAAKVWAERNKDRI